MEQEELPTIICKYIEENWEHLEIEYLSEQYSNLKTFAILLDGAYRASIIKSFARIPLGNYPVELNLLLSYKTSNAVKNDIKLGLKLGEFFIEMGSFIPAIEVLYMVRDTCRTSNDPLKLKMLIECFTSLLYAQAYSYLFKIALETVFDATEILFDTDPSNRPNCANLYSSFAFVYFMYGEYYHALQYTNLAIKELKILLPNRIIIQVLRQSAKVYVVNKLLPQARLLIQHAIALAGDYRRSNPYIYSETIMDYGFYFCRVNSYLNATKEYQKAVNIFTNLYGENHIYVAIAKRDLAYTQLCLDCHKYAKTVEENLCQVANISMNVGMYQFSSFNDMFRNSIDEIRVSCLQLLARDDDNGTLPRDVITCRYLSIHLHRKYFDQQWHQPSIKTIDCIISLGHLYLKSNSYENAKTCYQVAGDMVNKLPNRCNVEYFISKMYLAQLGRISRKFEEQDVIEAIKSLDIAIKTLIKYEKRDCENLGFFYEEVKHLYLYINKKVKSVEYNLALSAWKVLVDVADFDPIRNHLSKQELITTVVQLIEKLNVTDINRFGYAAVLEKATLESNNRSLELQLMKSNDNVRDWLNTINEVDYYNNYYSAYE